MNASVFRNTRFEIHAIQQKANSFTVACSERGGAVQALPGGGAEPVRVPVLDLEEEMFTDEEMSLVHQALELLEVKFAAKYDGWTSAPERMHEAVTRATVAEDLARQAESRRKSAELKALELEARQAEKLAELTALDEQIAARKAPK